MGRSHRGELADILFFHKAERNIREKMKRHDIQFYCRFTDDILTIAKDTKSANEFFEKHNEYADYCTLTYDEEPSVEDEYLSMKVILENNLNSLTIWVKNSGLNKGNKNETPTKRKFNASRPCPQNVAKGITIETNDIVN